MCSRVTRHWPSLQSMANRLKSKGIRTVCTSARRASSALNNSGSPPRRRQPSPLRRSMPVWCSSARSVPWPLAGTRRMNSHITRCISRWLSVRSRTSIRGPSSR
ncbi:hypothetical protein WR25_15091 [Diploscapter pachys]|uniref:Uncharacterized protein n=1 Tax=Diploscapter pachys TaxID=2018661 RepID=A0A2A2M6P6_9BILA|nr:hypothetical protein WR25_15091 [Diploscapter pachys]